MTEKESQSEAFGEAADVRGHRPVRGDQPRHYGAHTRDPDEIPDVRTGDGYYNTTIGEEMRYQSNWWVSVASHTLTCGRNGTTTPDQFFHGADGRWMSPQLGYAVPPGVITYISVVRAHPAVESHVEVVVNGEPVGLLFLPKDKPVVEARLFGVFPRGILSVKNGPGKVESAQVMVVFKRRAEETL